MIASLEDIEIREGMDGLSPARIATLYRRAPLLRPTDDADALRRMYEASSLVLSAWEGERLVGVARVMTDGVLFSYLCDLAVEPDVQGAGVGRRLIETIQERCRGTELLLRDSDLSSGFYDRLGFSSVENAWAKQV